MRQRSTLSGKFQGILLKLAVGAGLGCGPASAPEAFSPAAEEAAASPHPAPQPSEASLPWASHTQSPGPTTFSAFPCSGRLRLAAVAEQLAQRELSGEPPYDLQQLTLLLRAQGVPYVWPRLWAVRGSEAQEPRMREALAGWLRAVPAAAQTRCGIAAVTGAVSGERALAAVVVSAVAELEPLPTRARVGQWLQLAASLPGEASGPRVVLLGPEGPPLSPPATLHDGRLRATFAVDRPGLWRVQATADLGGGPRPVLEAWVSVGVPPPTGVESATPGDSDEPRAEPSKLDGAGGDAPRDQLARWINAARRAAGLPRLVRSLRLDELAQSHAEAMRARGLAAHDVGFGGPAQRLQQAGLRARRLGENVAMASTLRGAHRALWNSPSHRQVLLDPAFREVGLGIATAAGAAAVGESHRVDQAPARVWVSEVFVDHGTVLSVVTTVGCGRFPETPTYLELSANGANTLAPRRRPTEPTMELSAHRTRGGPPGR